ncbi:hypothetical protein CVT25_014275 [Psilocybe cyanescens]|uniref:Uncharacterized protein n=1 Tax=Psilocybe cyanescens TaxID=93625 RepID=A0A409XKW8_PSICY|nr:hypothetical protein CVT25_014275 [Psilocybe cyanescens]
MDCRTSSPSSPPLLSSTPKLCPAIRLSRFTHRLGAIQPGMSPTIQPSIVQTTSFNQPTNLPACQPWITGFGSEAMVWKLKTCIQLTRWQQFARLPPQPTIPPLCPPSPSPSLLCTQTQLLSFLHFIFFF